MRLLTIIAAIFILSSCSNSNKTSFDAFEGTWKVEGKNQYESWTKASENEFTGISYSLEENKRNIWEELSINMQNDEWFYTAMVKSQNEGQTINFKLNSKESSYFSFENPKHDFPKQIIYRILSPDKMEVRVLGDSLNSFSYLQIKQ